MEKEQILSTLKEKLGQTSFSDRSLTSYVENNLPNEGTEPDDAYWNKHVSIIKSFQGQFNADVSASVSSQIDAKVAEYYQKNPDKLKEYIKSHPELIAPPSAEKEDKGVAELKSKLEAMEKRMQEQNDARVHETLRGKVIEKMKLELKKNDFIINNALWEDAVNEAEIKDGQSVEELYSSAKAIYESKFKRVFGEDGAKPFEKTQSTYTPPAGNGVVKSYFEKKKKREGWGAKQ